MSIPILITQEQNPRQNKTLTIQSLNIYLRPARHAEDIQVLCNGKIMDLYINERLCREIGLKLPNLAKASIQRYKTTVNILPISAELRMAFKSLLFCVNKSFDIVVENGVVVRQVVW